MACKPNYRQEQCYRLNKNHLSLRKYTINHHQLLCIIINDAKEIYTSYKEYTVHVPTLYITYNTVYNYTEELVNIH